ncbi:hypothetical protein BSLG_008945 [Batrachochytrium salamandrivorans]|nr:hypothetical protein BSLG_008945 [Batrachochytrium salamandrivorans]
MAEARSIKVDEMLNEINEEHQIMEDQHSSDLQRLIQEKEAIEAHTAEFEALLSEAADNMQVTNSEHVHLFQTRTNEFKEANARITDLETKYKVVCEHYDAVLDQKTNQIEDLMNSQIEFEMRVVDLNAQLEALRKEYDILDTQYMVQIQQMSTNVATAEARVSELEEVLSETAHSNDLQSDQHSLELSRVLKENQAYEMRFFELQSQMETERATVFSKLENTWKKARDEIQRCISLESALNLANLSVEDVKHELNVLHEKYTDSENQRTCILELQDRLNEKLQNAQIDFQRLEQDYQLLCRNTAEIQERADFSDSKLDELYKDVDTLTTENMILTENNSRLEERLHKETLLMQEKSTELDAIQHSLRLPLEKHHESKEDLEEQIECLNLCIVERDRLNRELEQKYSNKCRDAERLSILLEDERSEKENEMTLFEQDALQSSIDQKRLQSRIDELMTEIESLQESNRSVTQQDESASSARMDAMSSQLAARQVECEQLRNSLQTLSMLLEHVETTFHERDSITAADYEQIRSKCSSLDYSLALEFKKTLRRVSELEQDNSERGTQIEDLKLRLRRALQESNDNAANSNWRASAEKDPESVPVALAALEYLQTTRSSAGVGRASIENTELVLSVTKAAMLEQEVHTLKKRLQTVAMCLADEKGQRRKLELEIMRLEDLIQSYRNMPIAESNGPPTKLIDTDKKPAVVIHDPIPDSTNINVAGEALRSVKPVDSVAQNKRTAAQGGSLNAMPHKRTYSSTEVDGKQATATKQRSRVRGGLESTIVAGQTQKNGQDAKADQL